MRRWRLRTAFWALALWSMFWVVGLIVGGGSVVLLPVAIFGFFSLSAAVLGTRYQRRMEDWERRKHEAETLEALKREALESREWEREVAELQEKEDRR